MADFGTSELKGRLTVVERGACHAAGWGLLIAYESKIWIDGLIDGLIPGFLQGKVFAATGHVMRSMEAVAVSASQQEPVLLVGETGTGKTTLVQHLAEQVWLPFNGNLAANKDHGAHVM